MVRSAVIEWNHAMRNPVAVAANSIRLKRMAICLEWDVTAGHLILRLSVIYRWQGPQTEFPMGKLVQIDLDVTAREV